MPEQTNNYHFDVVLFGAGIAGLWLLNRLQQEGYSCCLLESDSIGGKQSMASQGMIHGGIKYALSGVLNDSSEIIASMPDHWKACLEGKGDVDLQGLPVLSEDFYLWSTGGLGSKLTSFFASKLTRGRVEKVSNKNNPAALNHNAFKGKAYKLVDVVMDVPALTQHLAAPYKDRIFKIDAEQLSYDKNSNTLQLNQHTPETNAATKTNTSAKSALKNNITLTAQQWLCTAGEGNGDLIKLFGSTDIDMQLRPLQQVFVKSSELPAFYGHCIGASASPSPRLTVSSHQCEDGEWAWYLGGDLATEGVKRSQQEQIAHAKKELETLFPWYNWNEAKFSTLTIDRAEPKQKSLIKPDDAFIANSTANPNVCIAWPTKLTLAPALANQTIELLQQLGIQKSTSENLPTLPHPEPRQTEWHKAFTSNKAH